MDPKTRRPTALPQNIIDTYRVRDERVNYDLTEPDTVPPTALWKEFTVNEDLIDENDHMASGEYIAITEIAVKDLWKRQSMITEGHIKDMVTSYKRENLLGDKLCTRCWQDETQPFTVDVVIVNVSRGYDSSYSRVTLFDNLTFACL